MSSFIAFQPCSQAADWLMLLRTQKGAYRVLTAMRQLNYLSAQAVKGNAQSIIALYCIDAEIKNTCLLYQLHTARLKKRIKRYAKSDMQYQPQRDKARLLPLYSPIAALFFQLLQGYDTLMCYSESCRCFAKSNQHMSFFSKHRVYFKKLLHIVQQAAKGKRDSLNYLNSASLSEEDSAQLAFALQSDVTPKMSHTVFNQLIAQAMLPVLYHRLIINKKEIV